MSVQTLIQVRRGTASEWRVANSTLSAGEWGFETDTKRYKIGDGLTSWNSLAYSSILPSSNDLTGVSGIGVSFTSNSGIPVRIAVTGIGSSQVTDFNSSVSGLLPVTNIVAGSGITISSSNAIYTINSTATGGTPSPTGNFVVESLHVSNRYTETVSAISISSNTLVINLDTCNLFNCALNSNINTLTISNVPSTSGVSIGFTIIFTADGTPRSVSWPNSVKWQAGTAPNITSVNGKIDTFSFLSVNNGTSWLGFVGGQNY